MTSYIANNAVTNDKIQSLDYSKLNNIPTSSSVPIGGIILWSTPRIPTGFLECNGSVVDPNSLSFIGRIDDKPSGWRYQNNIPEVLTLKKKKWKRKHPIQDMLCKQDLKDL